MDLTLFNFPFLEIPDNKRYTIISDDHNGKIYDGGYITPNDFQTRYPVCMILHLHLILCFCQTLVCLFIYKLIDTILESHRCNIKLQAFTELALARINS